MEYKLVDKTFHRVRISEDKRALSIDYTLNGVVEDGELSIPFSEGMTVNIACPAGLLEEIDTAIADYFSNKYKNK